MNPLPPTPDVAGKGVPLASLLHAGNGAGHQFLSSFCPPQVS